MDIRQRYFDLSVGLFMMMGMAALVVMALKVSGLTDIHAAKGYRVGAEFSDIGGLRVGAPVTVSGVKIGEVINIELKKGDLVARVSMMLRGDKPIPYQDASARILTQGLLGGNYISIVPGFDEDANDQHPYLREGDVIAKTQEAIILENLIGQLIFNMNKK